ncbi:AMP-dependent synthetase/ligase [Brevibacterium yomogidense]|uniref:AMP-dependent synthetase/ligase n=1 Tax=Brevibacterium yomogidense TaxID=946573 RepID=UPI0018DF9DE4
MTHPSVTPSDSPSSAAASDRFTVVAIADGLRQASTMAEVLVATARTVPDHVALRSHETGQEWTYGETLTRIGAVVQKLRELGVRRGQPVALMLRNRPEFHVVDAAAMMLGAVPFSIYNTSAPEQIAFLLTDSGAEVVVAESVFLPSLQEALTGVPSVGKLLLIDQDGGELVTGSLVTELAATGTDFDFSTIEQIAPDDVLTLIYTSGTTGAPKGVELTHRGMLVQLQGVHTAMPLPGLGRQVSFLPAAHVADRWTSHYSAFMTYANTLTSVADMAAVAPAVAQTRPTLFGAVPRVWEKFKAALEAGYDGDLQADARANPAVGEAVRAKLGLDGAAWVVTGAAPTPPAVIEFFRTLGLPLCEMLGMSEVSCGVAVNTPDALRPGSVGRPLDTVEVALADDGEVLIGGPQVMKGYRGAPEKTAEAIDDAGWLHTGDIGRVDEDGFLWIIDRKKEIIINAAGKNMAPTAIEMAVRSAGNLVEQIAVIGDGRRYNVALIVADPAQAAELDEAELQRRVQEQVDRANATLARVEQIKKFTILPQPWRPGHELTPTMKVRRHVVDDLYAAQIEELYA